MVRIGHMVLKLWAHEVCKKSTSGTQKVTFSEENLGYWLNLYRDMTLTGMELDHNDCMRNKNIRGAIFIFFFEKLDP